MVKFWPNFSQNGPNKRFKTKISGFSIQFGQRTAKISNASFSLTETLIPFTVYLVGLTNSCTGMDDADRAGSS